MRDELISQLSQAQADAEAAKVALGQAIRAGNEKAKAAAATRMAEADAVVASLRAELGAVEAADRMTAQEDQDRADRESERKLKEALDAAEQDLKKVRAAAVAVDKALSDLDDAMANMDGCAKHFIQTHGGIGIHPNAADWLNLRGWARPVASHLLYRSRSEIRQRLRDGYTDFSGGSVENSVPDFTAVLVGRKRSQEAA